MLIKPIVCLFVCFLTFSLSSASLDLKVPNKTITDSSPVISLSVSPQWREGCDGKEEEGERHTQVCGKHSSTDHLDNVSRDLNGQFNLLIFVSSTERVFTLQVRDYCLFICLRFSSLSSL